jgi:hypothetical protein
VSGTTQQKTNRGDAERRERPNGVTAVEHGVSQAPCAGPQARFLRVTSLVLLEQKPSPNELDGTRGENQPCGQLSGSPLEQKGEQVHRHPQDRL